VWGMWRSRCEREDRGIRKGTQRRRTDAFQPRGEGFRREEHPASPPLSPFKETTTSWLSVGVFAHLRGHASLWQVVCICLPRPPPDERFPALPVLLSFPSIPFPPPFLPRPTSQRTVAANGHGGQERRRRKPGLAPSHTQAGRGQGISTSPTLFFGGGGCSVWWWWWWWLWSGRARVWCGCINAAGTHEHRQGLSSISLTQLQRQEQGQAPSGEQCGGNKETSRATSGPARPALMQGLPTTALCASLASLHLVDKARGCLGDATTKARARGALLPLPVPYVPTRCRRGRVVAAARPCHYRQPTHHSHTIGWVSSYTLVC
jgi:hypothetical protein